MRIFKHQEACEINYRDKVNENANKDHVARNYRINNYNTTTSKSFEYKTKIIGIISADKNTEVVVPLKYLSNI